MQDHISYTQIRTYIDCSLRYKFAYVDKLPPETISVSLIFGSAMHEALKELYLQKQKSGSVDLAAVRESFERCFL
jgi:putative RecB family exonuclease